MAGHFVANVTSWSTQVPPGWWIAVVGRSLRSPVGGLVHLSRSNKPHTAAEAQPFKAPDSLTRSMGIRCASMFPNRFVDCA